MPINCGNTEIYEIITDAMKKSKEKTGRKVRVGFSLCSHWCVVCQIFPVLPSTRAAGLCFLGPLWLAGERSYEWRAPCATSRLRISLLPSRARRPSLPSGLATSTAWDKGCPISLGLWAPWCAGDLWPSHGVTYPAVTQAWSPWKPPEKVIFG